MAYQIIKRTFEALKFPKGSKERNRLNESPVTSEYYTSFKYILKRPFYMSDGTLHPQKWIMDIFKTRIGAMDYAKYKNLGDETVFDDESLGEISINT